MDKLYAVKDILFRDKTICANEVELLLKDVSTEEVFDFEGFRIVLINHNGLGQLIDFEYFKKKRNMKC